MAWSGEVFRPWLYSLLGLIVGPNIKIYHDLQRDYALSSIDNRTLGFEKIFTLNLPSRSDRRDALTLMSSLSAFDITFVPGVARHELSLKEIPDDLFTGQMVNISLAEIGCWRGHMNTIRRVVEGGHSTALITEDDMDWDMRLRQQLKHLALGIRNLRGTDTMGSSPYSDGWDLIWIGHEAEKYAPTLRLQIPEYRSQWSYKIVARYFADSRVQMISFDPAEPVYPIHNDSTVPPFSELRSFKDDGPEWQHVFTEYPEHTRFIHKTHHPYGLLAYAVSFKGAQRLLYFASVLGLTYPVDHTFAEFCHLGFLQCYSVSPAMISSHKIKGSSHKQSDIESFDGYSPQSWSKDIVSSVRMQLEDILMGRISPD